VHHLLRAEALSDDAGEIKPGTERDDQGHAQKCPRSALDCPLGIAPCGAHQQSEAETESEKEIQGPHTGKGSESAPQYRPFCVFFGADAEAR